MKEHDAELLKFDATEIEVSQLDCVCVDFVTRRQLCLKLLS